MTGFAMRLRLLSFLTIALASTASAQSAITGTVVENGVPVVSATVSAARVDSSVARETTTDAEGRFRLSPLTAGFYTVTVRKLGYRAAVQGGVRVSEGQTVSLGVSLTRAPRQLSTIQIISTPTSVDVSTPEMSLRFDRVATELLPTARDASSLIALVPGARKNQLWGGAPGVSNDYQLDGVSMNHPGLGGDFLSLSVDWIDALDVRGLGAGAEHGNFQGGIINAILKTGTNERRRAFRANYESERLTATNFHPSEEGVEQAGRREVSGELLGPIARDKLFYFAGAQLVRRDFRSPNLLTTTARDFQPLREEHLDARGLGKLTWLPAVGQRVDGLLGLSTANADHAGINGIDDPTATIRIRQPTVFYKVGWSNLASPRNALDVRVAGYNSQESRLGYEGPVVPGIQLLQPGRLPTMQNSAFDERRDASSLTGTIEWRATRTALGATHELALGAETSRGRWRDTRTRNGGVTWRPYSGDSTFDPFDAATWNGLASDWGGDIHLDSYVGSQAVYAQDYLALGTRLTLTPGLRFSRWTGDLTPWCGGGTTQCDRFRAASATGFDPRLGAVWDVTGRNTLAVKAHAGRYHQGMYSLFFDRATGGNVYDNHRLYFVGPQIPTTRTTFTTAQRDAPGSGFSRYYDEEVLDEAGRVENYRQPYVDQAMLGVEKSFGDRWKAEVVYMHRRNGDIVGLIDRNRATNYSPAYNIRVNDLYVIGRTLGPDGRRLELQTVYMSNKDLREFLITCQGTFSDSCPSVVAGYSLSDSLPWNPDMVLTTIPGARRTYDQLSLMLRTTQQRWRGEASITSARLRGNVPGVAGFATTGTRFSAGPHAHPNEAINIDGPLPDALELEGKVWLSFRLPHTLQGGLLFTHTIGERFTAGFQFSGRYAYTDSLDVYFPSPVFRSLLGQTLNVEPRGSRHYASRDVVDLHLEWRPPKFAVLTIDLFNAISSDALTSVNSIVGNQIDADPTTYFMAGRIRVAPRSLRIGMRVE